jgi:hypothetical protein
MAAEMGVVQGCAALNNLKLFVVSCWAGLPVSAGGCNPCIVEGRTLMVVLCSAKHVDAAAALYKQLDGLMECMEAAWAAEVLGGLWEAIQRMSAAAVQREDLFDLGGSWMVV